MSPALESQPGLVPRPVQEFGHIPGKLGRGPLLEGGPPEEQQGRESLPLHLLGPEDGHRLPGQLVDLGGAPLLQFQGCEANVTIEGWGQRMGFSFRADDEPA